MAGSQQERYDKAVAEVETSPEKAVDELRALQEEIARLGYNVSSNETLQDVSTTALGLIPLEHVLAVAYTQLSTGGTDGLQNRLKNLHAACDLWHDFLSTCQRLEVLTKTKHPQEVKDFEDLQEVTASIQNENRSSSSMRNGDAGWDVTSSSQSQPRNVLSLAPPNRDVKIARFRAKQALEQQKSHLQALMQRRSRLGLEENEEMDGHDQESALRALYLADLEIAKTTALEEWAAVLREIPLLTRMIQSPPVPPPPSSRSGQASSSSTTSRHPSGPAGPAGKQPPPLQVTQITRDSTTGQLQMQRQEIQSSVFRPGWNMPTQSLQELAEREVAAALDRESRQAAAEEQQKHAPRRYDQLQRDGMEDNDELVNASAALDRAWDDWKDENPRGSGNKRGNVGDRNF